MAIRKLWEQEPEILGYSGVPTSDSDLWVALRQEAGVREHTEAKAKNSKKSQKETRSKSPPLDRGYPQGPRLPHPWETETFDPGDPELVMRVRAGRGLSGLILGVSAYQVGEERWVLVQNDFIWWGSRNWLAYRLPPEWGPDASRAAVEFREAWQREANRWDPKPVPEVVVPMPANLHFWYDGPGGKRGEPKSI